MTCPMCNGRLRVTESRTSHDHLTGKLRRVAKKQGLLDGAAGTAWCVRERKCDDCARVLYTTEEVA